MSRSIYVIEPEHSLDIITNSSSELFIIDGSSVDAVKEIVKCFAVNYNSQIDWIASGDSTIVDNYFLSLYIEAKYKESYKQDDEAICFGKHKYKDIVGDRDYFSVSEKFVEENLEEIRELARGVVWVKCEEYGTSVEVRNILNEISFFVTTY